MPWWDVSRVTDTAGLFQDWPEFNEDIRRWDMARVTTVRDMFHPRARFDRPLGEWDVARAGDFADLFGPQEKAAPVAKGESLTEDNPCPALPP